MSIYDRPTPRSHRYVSYIVWGSFFLVWLAVEILGLGRRHRGSLIAKIPWFTLSETVWSLEKAWWPVRVALAVAGGDVLIHLLFGTPLWP